MVLFLSLICLSSPRTYDKGGSVTRILLPFRAPPKGRWPGQNAPLIQVCMLRNSCETSHDAHLGNKIIFIALLLYNKTWLLQGFHLTCWNFSMDQFRKKKPESKRGLQCLQGSRVRDTSIFIQVEIILMNNFVRGKWTFQKAIRINAIFYNSREKQKQGLLITNMIGDEIVI